MRMRLAVTQMLWNIGVVNIFMRVSLALISITPAKGIL